MARLLVGMPALQGDIEKYKTRFDLVEIRPVDASLPRIATLRKWRKTVPPSFVFSVVLPRAVGELKAGPELEEALTVSLEVAAAVEARCIVLQTPASVRPTAANKKRLAQVFERILPEGTVRCWEPAGLWEREEVLVAAREMDVIAVFDAAREPLPPGPIAYTRLRALGNSVTLGATVVERVADRLRKRRESFVVVEGSGEAQRVRTALIQALAKKRERMLGSHVVRPMAPGPLIAEDEEQ